MNAEIITTGTELLLGEIIDTNAVHIARQLREIGLNLYYKTTVGDNRQRLADVLRLGLNRSDVIIITGGLGPTVDDITREAVADATGLPLVQRQELVARLQAQFASWGRELTANNLRQTYLPETAQVIPNPIGTAPGFILETGQGCILCLPGVPHEMKRMLADSVLPFLQQQQGGEGRVLHTRTLHTAGIGESAIDARIGHLMQSGNPTVGLAAHLGRADVRLVASAATQTEAEALLTPVEAEIRALLAPWIYGADEETLGGVVARLLREQGATLALVETHTGGRVAAGFDEENGDILAMSACFADVAALAQAFEIAEGVGVDEESARSAAGALLDQSQADYALVLLGTTGLDQGYWSVDRGETWLALATPDEVVTRHYSVGGADEFTASWLAVQGLNFLRSV